MHVAFEKGIDSYFLKLHKVLRLKREQFLLQKELINHRRKFRKDNEGSETE